MVQDQLRETLTSLHSTLEETSDVDSETRQLLLSITADIEKILADDKSPVIPDESLSGRLEDVMREFKANHPVIGGLLQRLSDGLANMGI